MEPTGSRRPIRQAGFPRLGMAAGQFAIGAVTAKVLPYRLTNGPKRHSNQAAFSIWPNTGGLVPGRRNRGEGGS